MRIVKSGLFHSGVTFNIASGSRAEPSYFVSVVAWKLVGFAGVDTLDTYVEDVLCENWPAKGWKSWLVPYGPEAFILMGAYGR